jgi:hypothetical protein
MWASKPTVTQLECILLEVTFTTLVNVWKASSSVRNLFYNCHTLLKSFFIQGLYSGIFALHLQIYASRKEPDGRKKNIVFYALLVLYLLSAALIAIDIAAFVAHLFVSDHELSFRGADQLSRTMTSL